MPYHLDTRTTSFLHMIQVNLKRNLSLHQKLHIIEHAKEILAIASVQLYL